MNQRDDKLRQIQSNSERCNRTAEVVSSNLIGSTNFHLNRLKLNNNSSRSSVSPRSSPYGAGPLQPVHIAISVRIHCLTHWPS
jgi:hypothetical protein